MASPEEVAAMRALFEQQQKSFAEQQQAPARHHCTRGIRHHNFLKIVFQKTVERISHRKVRGQWGVTAYIFWCFSHF